MSLSRLRFHSKAWNWSSCVLYYSWLSSWSTEPYFQCCLGDWKPSPEHRQGRSASVLSYLNLLCTKYWCWVLVRFWRIVDFGDPHDWHAGCIQRPRFVGPQRWDLVFKSYSIWYLYSDCQGNNTAAESPFVIAINRAGIKGTFHMSPSGLDLTFWFLVLPHIVNGAIFTSAFSAGNSFLFCSSRVLYGLALRGQAPKILTYCTKKGLPLYAVLTAVSPHPCLA